MVPSDNNMLFEIDSVHLGSHSATQKSLHKHTREKNCKEICFLTHFSSHIVVLLAVKTHKQKLGHAKCCSCKLKDGVMPVDFFI